MNDAIYDRDKMLAHADDKATRWKLVGSKRCLHVKMNLCCHAASSSCNDFFGSSRDPPQWPDGCSRSDASLVWVWPLARPCGQTGPGARAVGTAWAARQPC